MPTPLIANTPPLCYPRDGKFDVPCGDRGGRPTAKQNKGASERAILILACICGVRAEETEGGLRAQFVGHFEYAF